MLRGNVMQRQDRDRGERANEKQTPSQRLLATPLLLQRAQRTPHALTAAEVKHLQRTVGNRAVVSLLSTAKTIQRKSSAEQTNHVQPDQVPAAAQVGNSFQALPDIHSVGAAAAEPSIQRAGFSEYLRKNRLPKAVTTSDQEEIVFAWMLDQNIHDLVELMSGTMEEPVLQELASLTKNNLTTGDVVNYLRSKGAPGVDAPPAQHVSFLNNFMKVAPEAITNRISSSIQTNKGKDASLIKWHGLTAWGAGTGVTLLMRPGGLVKGSTPKGSPVWMKQLEQHVPINGGTTIYVQGHLLNHNIGGPGLDYNMVPLTGKPAKNVGANDANAEHLNLIETDAKKTWDEVERGNYPEAEYQVIPDYSRAARPGTVQIRGEANKLSQIRLAWIQDRANFVAKQKPTDIENAYKQMLQSFGIPIPQILPPQQQMIEGLANQMASADLDNNFGQLKLLNHPIAQEIVKQIDAGILSASTLGNADNYSIKDLLYLVTENAKVWEAEDQYVPEQLHVSLKWKDKNGTVQQHPANKVPITLPSSPSLVGFRPKKKSEDA